MDKNKNMNKKKVILGIGIPGSGKSTYLKRIVKENDFAYICPDDIREELTGNTSDQSKNKEVWELAYKRLETLLSTDTNTIVFDATQANKEQRIRCIENCKKYGAEVVEGLFFDTPLRISKQRNSSRDRKVPEHVLEKMNSFLEKDPPKIDDGFDSLIILDENLNKQN